MANLHKNLLRQGYQLAYTFTPRSYYCVDKPHQEGDAEMMMKIIATSAGRSLDEGRLSEIIVIGIESTLAKGEKIDDSVRARKMVYVK